MEKEVYWASNISISVVGDDLFVFDEITNNVFLYREIKKKCFLLIENSHNINDILKTLKLNSKEGNTLEDRVISSFIEKCIELGLLIYL